MILAAALLGPLALGPQEWGDLPVFVWRARHRQGPPPAGLLDPFGGTNRFRGEETEWIGAGGVLSYTTNAAGRDDLHLDGGPRWEERVRRWIEERDPKALHREPCLSDPATRARLFRNLEATLEEVAGNRAPAVALGDEVSLTPYGNPLDLCRGPHCEARWREWAGERELELDSPTTDRVRRALLEGDASLVGPWLARRRFHREVLHELLDELGGLTRGKARAGLLGLTHETAFGGLSIDRSVSTADFLEAYPVGASRELLHTRLDELDGGRDSLLTLYATEDGPPALAWKAWDHWLRGGDGFVIWHDAALEDHPARAKRLARTVASIRRLERRFPAPPLRYGVALLHDADSIAYAWLRDVLLDGPTWPHRRNGLQQREGTRERKVRSWLRLFEDAGALPGAVSIERLDASISERFGVLVAPELGVLDDTDLRALEAHLERGGVLIVDGPLGQFDRRGRKRSEDVLARLRDDLRGRVIEAPAGLGGYLERRENPRRTERLRALARGWLRQAGAPALEFGLGPEMAQVPWLVSLRPVEEALACAPPADGAELFLAMLPNVEAPVRLELDLEPPPGYRAERLAPSAGKALEPGEPALWVLRPDEN